MSMQSESKDANGRDDQQSARDATAGAGTGATGGQAAGQGSRQSGQQSSRQDSQQKAMPPSQTDDDQYDQGTVQRER